VTASAGSIQPIRYKGFLAYSLESEAIKLIVVPELGAKIVTMLDKRSGKEWLAGAGGRKLRKVAYASDFAQADVSGWDECFPTVLACSYPGKGQFEGRFMPDHGELWSIPWEARVGPTGIVCSVQGRALPYRFQREMSLADERTFRFAYRVANEGEETWSALWCAHPLFLATEHTEIFLPGEVTEVLCVDGGRKLQSGAIYSWPEGDDSLPYPIHRIGPSSSRDSRKFYVSGTVKEGRAGLIEKHTGASIELLWSPEQLPYLGVWVNEGGYLETPVCAIEPCNGFYDDLAAADANDRRLRLEPGQACEWELYVRLNDLI